MILAALENSIDANQYLQSTKICLYFCEFECAPSGVKSLPKQPSDLHCALI